jgi:hypothetical protein
MDARRDKNFASSSRIIACLAKSSDKLTAACKKMLAEAEKK